MNVSLVVIITLVVGISFLLILLYKYIILPRRAAVTATQLDKTKILQAIRTAKSAIEKDPQNVEAHYLLGKAYLADKREEQALREFKSVSRMGLEGKDIPEIEFRENAARLYAKYHEEDEALKEYVLLIKRRPENPVYYFEAGKIFSTRNRNDLAEQYLRKAISLNPKNANYHAELGMLYYLMKKTKEAGAEFDAAAELNPTDAKIQLYQGKALKDSKDFSGAVPYLEKASRDQIYKVRALVELGSCYMSLNAMDKAIHELERAVNCIEKQDESDSLYARYFLAMCYEKTRDLPKAVAQWELIYAQKKNFRDVGEKLTQYIEYRQGNTASTTPRKA